MTATVVLVQGFTGPIITPHVGWLYDGMTRAINADHRLGLRHGGVGQIDSAYQAFDQEVQRIRRGNDIVWVAHSAAGPFVAKQLLAHHGDQAVLVGPNMNGVNYLSAVNAFLGLFSWAGSHLTHAVCPFLHELSPQSRFLADVRQRAPWFARRVTIVASPSDVVVPWQASIVEGAHTTWLGRPPDGRHGDYRVNLSGIDHFDLMRHPGVQDVVAGYVQDLQGSPQAA